MTKAYPIGTWVPQPDKDETIEDLKNKFQEALTIIEDLMYQHVGRDDDGFWNYTGISADENAADFLSRNGKG